MIFLPSASTTKGRKKSAVEKKEIVVAHMANKRQIPAREKIVNMKSLYHYCFICLRFLLLFQESYQTSSCIGILPHEIP